MHLALRFCMLRDPYWARLGPWGAYNNFMLDALLDPGSRKVRYVVSSGISQGRWLAPCSSHGCAQGPVQMDGSLTQVRWLDVKKIFVATLLFALGVGFILISILPTVY